MVRKELDYFFAEFFAPKRQKSLVKQGFLPQVVKSSCNDGSSYWARTSDTLINSQVLSRAGCFTPTNRAVECYKK